MAEMFWLPVRSIWLAIIIMLRRPDHTTSKTVRYGMAASRTSSAGRAAMGGAPTMRAASPSVSTMSGEKVRLASRAPERGNGAEGADHDLARVAPDVGAGNDAGLGPGDAGIAGLAHCGRSATLALYSSSSTKTYRLAKASHSAGSVADAAYSFWNFSSRP